MVQVLNNLLKSWPEYLTETIIGKLLGKFHESSNDSNEITFNLSKKHSIYTLAVLSPVISLEKSRAILTCFQNCLTNLKPKLENSNSNKYLPKKSISIGTNSEDYLIGTLNNLNEVYKNYMIKCLPLMVNKNSPLEQRRI